MDLFKLVGTIAVNSSGAMSAISSVSSAAVSAGKTIAKGIAVGTVALAGLTVKSLEAAGELEQNMGGSEAVFKKYAESMQKTATTAFKNMGLSQSDFLATANKMGALFQGAGFNIKQSADMSAQAMQRASDVASIMGVDINSAMEAVAGMAKGNFTMMDNLGVAINDTTLKMYAQKNKLGELKTTQDKVNAAYLLFMEKSAYAAGNYAKENDTLSGSLNTAKAAFTNFLAGVGSVDDVVSSFVNAGEVIIKNVNMLLPKLITGIQQLITSFMPYIPTLIQTLLPTLINGATSLITGLAQALPQIISVIIGVLPGIIANIGNALIGMIPVLKSAAKQLFGMALESGILDNIPNVISNALDLIQNFADTLAKYAPMVIQAGIMLITKLVTGIVDSLPVLIEKVPTIVSTFANIINDNAPTVLKAGMGLIVTIVTGIIKAIPTLIKNIPKIITAIVDVWEAFNWIQLGKNVITGLVNGIKNMTSAVKTVGKNINTAFTNTLKNLPGNLKTLGKNVITGLKNSISSGISGIRTVGSNIFNALVNALKNLPSNLKTLGKNVITGLKNSLSSGVSSIKSVGKNIFNAVADTLKSLPSKLKSIGSDVVKGLWNGISNMSGWISNKIKGFGDGVLNDMKEFFGIHSPSTVMRDQVGKYLVEGIGVGVEENEDKAIKPFDEVVNGMTSGVQKADVEYKYNSTTYNNSDIRTNIEDILYDLFDKLFAILEKYLPECSNTTMVLDTGTLVAETAKAYDKQLGIIKRRNDRR